MRSARLTTQGAKSIQYGRVEVVAKVPKGDWLWPAIWMMPEESKYGIWPLSGEIDIMESRGNARGYRNGGRETVSSTIHWGERKLSLGFESDLVELKTRQVPHGRPTTSSELHKNTKFKEQSIPKASIPSVWSGQKITFTHGSTIDFSKFFTSTSRNRIYGNAATSKVNTRTAPCSQIHGISGR